MGKLDTAFVTNGHSSDAAKKTYQDLQAVLGETDVSVEAANHLAVMTDNEKDLQEIPQEVLKNINVVLSDNINTVFRNSLV
mgnify:FL=1